MKKWLIIAVLLCFISTPVHAASLEAPTAPDSVADLMPDPKVSFQEGLWQLISNALEQLRPEIGGCLQVCSAIVSISILLSLLRGWTGKGKMAADLCGIIAISYLLLNNTGNLISLAADTVRQISDYGKLLLPVMTAALASQGGGTSSASLYTATALFDTILTTVISGLLIPVVYVYLAFAVICSATGENMLAKIMDFVKWLMTWILKTILYVFTGYIGITGIISGTTDKAALKATKLTISGMVPVIGGILSDASETVLVSAEIVKNAAGVYGLLAVSAIVIGPFLQIGLQYLLLKVTAGLCDIIGDRKESGLIDHFCTAMRMLLAMTGACCIIQLISTVCFMKGMQ